MYESVYRPLYYALQSNELSDCGLETRLFTRKTKRTRKIRTLYKI